MARIGALILLTSFEYSASILLGIPCLFVIHSITRKYWLQDSILHRLKFAFTDMIRTSWKLPLCLVEYKSTGKGLKSYEVWIFVVQERLPRLYVVAVGLTTKGIKGVWGCPWLSLLFSSVFPWLSLMV